MSQSVIFCLKIRAFILHVCLLLLHRKLSCVLVTVSLASPSASQEENLNLHPVRVFVFPYVQEMSDYSAVPVRVTVLDFIDFLSILFNPAHEVSSVMCMLELFTVSVLMVLLFHKILMVHL